MHLQTGAEYAYNGTIVVNGDVTSSVVRLSHFFVDEKDKTRAVCSPVDSPGLQDMFATDPKNLKIEKGRNR